MNIASGTEEVQSIKGENREDINKNKSSQYSEELLKKQAQEVSTLQLNKNKVELMNKSCIVLHSLLSD